jgi:type III secretory pathway component EscV
LGVVLKGPNQLRFSDLAAGIFVLALAALFVIPLPTSLLDILIVINLLFSFLLLFVAIYLPNIQEFLSFPAVLLLFALFRLGLNVASSRLILSQADAGRVIEAFGTFLLQGEIIVGIIIFAIITIVNFVVISRGAARVSEVAARFTLDALPGRQATIDADLRAGLLSASVAQIKRDELRREAQLYGAMDGAMKFVQGDAIAGIIIIFANALGGLYRGLDQGMPLAESVMTFTTLTVGDGLVSQIPALLTSICAGIVVTKVTANERITLGESINAELFSKPVPLFAAGVVLLFLAAVPGLPSLPFLLVAGAVFLFASNLLRQTEIQGDKEYSDSRSSKLNGRQTTDNSLPSIPNRFLLPASENSTTEIGSLLLRFGSTSLYPFFLQNREHYIEWWRGLRDDLYSRLGLNLLPFTVQAEPRSEGGYYALNIAGTLVGDGVINVDEILVELNPLHAVAFGIPIVREANYPLGQARVFWSKRSVPTLKILGLAEVRYLDAVQYILLKAAVFYAEHPEEAVSIADTHHLLKQLDVKFPGLVAEALNRDLIDVSRLTEVAQELVRDGIGIKDFKSVIEAVSAYCSHHRIVLANGEDFDRDHLISFIRVQRKRHLLRNYLSYRRTLKVFVLSPNVEETFEQIPLDSHFAPLALESAVLESLMLGLNRILEPTRLAGILPISVLCRGELRSRVSSFLRGTESSTRVLSYEELDPGIDIEQVGVWTK